MFIFLEDEEYDALNEECLSMGDFMLKRGEDGKEVLPHHMLWLDCNEVESLMFMGHTMIPVRCRKKTKDLLRYWSPQNICDESEVLSVYLVRRLMDWIRKNICNG